MKNYMLLLLLICSIYGNAQDKTRLKQKDRPSLTAVQQATLRTKQLALSLNLNEAQEKKMLALQLEQAKKREARHKTLETERKALQTNRYESRLKMLEERLEFKRKMQAFLSEKQLEKFESLKKAHPRKRLNRMRNHQ